MIASAPTMATVVRETGWIGQGGKGDGALRAAADRAAALPGAARHAAEGGITGDPRAAPDRDCLRRAFLLPPILFYLILLCCAHDDPSRPRQAVRLEQNREQCGQKEKKGY